MTDLLNGLGVEIELYCSDNFLKVKETLQRIGVASTSSNTLYQTCHILHKRGRYWIVMFKELFALDGKGTNINENDIQRRNVIVKLLSEWGLVSILDKEKVENAPSNIISQIKILPYKERNDWTLVSKYTVGKKKLNYNK